MNRVLFHHNVSLAWPASTSWYEFLRILHERLAESERMHYDDKDIMLVTEVRFENGPNKYQRPATLMLSFHRFSERGNISDTTSYDNIIPTSRDKPQYRINLEMAGTIVKAFTYERLD